MQDAVLDERLQNHARYDAVKGGILYRKMYGKGIHQAEFLQGGVVAQGIEFFR